MNLMKIAEVTVLLLKTQYFMNAILLPSHFTVMKLLLNLYIENLSLCGKSLKN